VLELIPVLELEELVQQVVQHQTQLVVLVEMV
jgi:hypothetical protein